MKPFISGRWHAWESNGKILLSDESSKQLKIFNTVDEAINYLYLSNEVAAARKLNEHKLHGQQRSTK